MNSTGALDGTLDTSINQCWQIIKERIHDVCLKGHSGHH